MIDYEKIEIVRSRRRTLGLEIKPGGKIIARVPLRASNLEIKKFIDEHEAWLNKHLAKMEKAGELDPVEQLSMEEIGELADKVGITLANMSVLKTGKAKAIKVSTLAKLCWALDCQPGDILEYKDPEIPE